MHRIAEAWLNWSKSLYGSRQGVRYGTLAMVWCPGQSSCAERLLTFPRSHTAIAALTTGVPGLPSHAVHGGEGPLSHSITTRCSTAATYAEVACTATRMPDLFRYKIKTTLLRHNPSPVSVNKGFPRSRRRYRTLARCKRAELHAESGPHDPTLKCQEELRPLERLRCNTRDVANRR